MYWVFVHASKYILIETGYPRKMSDPSDVPAGCAGIHVVECDKLASATAFRE